MATINFSQFELKTTPALTDYLVGYKGNGTGEYRTSIESVAALISATTTVYPTLSYNTTGNRLSISNGNTVTLSNLITSHQNLSVNASNKQLSITQGNTVSLSSFVVSDITTVPSATAISNIITVTQTQYNDIAVKNPDTLYVIV